MERSPATLIRVAILIAAISSLALGVYAAFQAEDQAVASSRNYYQIQNIDNGIPSRQFYSAVERLSDTRDTLIAAELTRNGQRAVYVARGGIGDEWLRHGYNSFTPGLSVEVHPLTDIPGGDVRQLYQFADRETADAFVKLVETSGYSGRSLQAHEREYLLGSAFGSALPCAIAICLALTFYSAVLSGRSTAIQALHGAGLFRTLGRDLGTALRSWAGLAAAAVCAIGGIAVVAKGYTAVDFLRYWTMVSAILFGTIIASALAGLIIVRSSPIVATIKGRTISGWILPTATILYLTIVVIFASSVPSVVNNARSVSALGAEAHAWNGLDDISNVYLTGARDEHASDAEVPGFAASVRRASADGHTLWANITKPRDAPESGITFHVAVMNRTAAMLSVNDAARRLIASVPDGEAIALDSTPDGDAVDQHNARLHPTTPAEGMCTTDCARFRTDTDVLTWTPYSMDRLLISDALVIVVPDDELMDQPDSEIFAAVSVGRLMFDNPQTIDRYIDRRIIGASQSVATTWRANQRSAQHELLLGASALVLSVALTVLMAVALAATCVVSRRDRFWVEFAHGVGWFRRHRLTLALQVTVLVGALWWTIDRMLQDLRLREDPMQQLEHLALTELTPGAAALIATVMLASTSIAVLVATRLARTPRTSR